ncbi:MAG: helix-turn-helix domain containing protein [Deltaproteobacteria bacterium]
MKELSKVIRERKKREDEQRYLSIMEAARKVFFFKGYTKATMDDIAIEAELSKTVIYKYFKAKDDLFCSLMIPAIDRVTSTMQGVEEKLLNGQYTSGEQLVRDHILSAKNEVS